MGAPVSVVILTFNEEQNLPFALTSVAGWSDDVHIVDSGSTDRTVDLARTHGAHVHVHAWKDWADQRNWALENCPLRHDWVLFLDADEQLTEGSRSEIAHRTASASPDCGGFFLRFDYIFLGKRLRRAMHPHLRLVRGQVARWQARGAREFCNLPANCPHIRARLIHEDHRGLGYFLEKLRRNAFLEASALWAKRNGQAGQDADPAMTGPLRARVWARLEPVLPGFARAWAFFTYRLLFCTDVRDGWTGVLFAYYFGLWYRLLIESKYRELCRSGGPKGV